MLQPKTYFDQIPLQTVKRIVEEQTRREEVAQAALRERLQVMTCGASEQNKRLVAFDVGLLPSSLQPEQLSSAQEFVRDENGQTKQQEDQTVPIEGARFRFAGLS